MTGGVVSIRPRVAAIFALIFALAIAPVSAARAAGGGESSFISADTVVIGCTAGGGASAFAAVLPLLTAGVTGGAGVAVTPAIVGSWTAIGCAVGVISGLIAIGTAWSLETWNEMRGKPATAP